MFSAFPGLIVCHKKENFEEASIAVTFSVVGYEPVVKLGLPLKSRISPAIAVSFNSVWYLENLISSHALVFRILSYS